MNPRSKAAAEALAREIAARAHAPYSGFRVGAVLEDAHGDLHAGCNIESASIGLSLCAERAALASAWSRGVRELPASMDLHADSETHPPLRRLSRNAPALRGRHGGLAALRRAGRSSGRVWDASCPVPGGRPGGGRERARSLPFGPSCASAEVAFIRPVRSRR